MEKEYRLNPIEASWGRTLWENLVVGSKCNCLDDRDNKFRRITPEDKIKETVDVFLSI